MKITELFPSAEDRKRLQDIESALLVALKTASICRGSSDSINPMPDMFELPGSILLRLTLLLRMDCRDIIASCSTPRRWLAPPSDSGYYRANKR